MRTRILRTALLLIAAFQVVLGLAFIVAPAATAELQGLPPAPGWANWLFAMMGARFLGYAVGMWLAARDPDRHLAWIWTMAGVQGIDWIATVVYLGKGDVTVANVGTAAFMPPLFLAAILLLAPRSRRRSAELSAT